VVCSRPFLAGSASAAAPAVRQMPERYVPDYFQFLNPTETPTVTYRYGNTGLP
jgi:hypothetical protein